MLKITRRDLVLIRFVPDLQMKILLGLCLAFALASATGDDSSSNHQYVFVTKQEPLDLLNFDPRHISSGSSGQKFQGGYYGGNRRRYGTFNTQGFHQHGHSNAFQPVTHQNFIPGFSHQSRPNALVFPASHGHHQNHIQTGGGYFPYPHNSYGRFPIVSYGPQSLIPNAG